MTRDEILQAVKNGANLSRADLSYADLSGADLSGVDMHRADLSYANLSYANLFGANLFGADLFGADLIGADLTDADLTDVDLTDVDLTGAKIGEHELIKFIVSAKRYDGYEFVLFQTTNGNIITAEYRIFSIEQYREHVSKKYFNSRKAESTLFILNYFENELKYV